MADTWSVEHLLKGLDQDLGVFTLKGITYQRDSGQYLCHVRSSTLRETYDVPEYDTSISIYHDAEHKLIGMFMRIELDIPFHAYEWAIGFLNKFQLENSMSFAHLAILPISEPEEKLEYLMLECGYHLSLVRHLPSQVAHQRLMTAMVADAMKRLYTTAHYMIDEIMTEYVLHEETRPN